MVNRFSLNNVNEESDFRSIFNFSEQSMKMPAVRFFKEFYLVQGFNKNTIWVSNDKYKLLIPPMTIKLTETIYDPFYSYFFKKAEDPAHLAQTQAKSQAVSRRESVVGNNASQPESKDVDIPKFYAQIRAGDLKFCLYYKSTSAIKVSSSLRPLHHLSANLPLT